MCRKHFALAQCCRRLEREKIVNENLRLQAQIAQIQSQARTEELMAQVYERMQVYMGMDDDEDP